MFDLHVKNIKEISLTKGDCQKLVKVGLVIWGFIDSIILSKDVANHLIQYLVASYFHTKHRKLNIANYTLQGCINLTA